MAPSWLDDPVGIGESFDIYSVSTLKEFATQTVSNYYNLNSDVMFDEIEQWPDASRPDNIKQVEMTIRNVDSNSQTNIYFLDPDDMGPLQDSDAQIKEWLRKVWYFEFGFVFRTYMPKDFMASEECYLWKL